jgi:hypothetical protein
MRPKGCSVSYDLSKEFLDLLSKLENQLVSPFFPYNRICRHVTRVRHSAVVDVNGTALCAHCGSANVFVYCMTPQHSANHVNDLAAPHLAGRVNRNRS